MSIASEYERLMLDLINEERTSRGLDPLTLELRLNEASEDHSLWMDETGNFSHTGVNGSDPGDRIRDAGFELSGSWTWGENVAFQSERGASGIADDVADLHQSLMNSPGHRANILNPDFELIGIGIEEGDGRGFDAVYVTQNFARTSAPVQLDLPTPQPVSPFAGSTGHDILFGDGDDNQISGIGGNDTLSGGGGEDLILGGGGKDRLRGNGNDDILKGGNGADHLIGNGGNDRLIGGGGGDTFVFSQGRDIVTDFDTEEAGERIDLRHTDAIVDFADLIDGGHLRQAGSNVIINDLDGNTLVLKDVDLSDLETNDFIF